MIGLRPLSLALLLLTGPVLAADDYAIPPGDPWYEPAPQQRGTRAAERRINPHWFDGSDRFWYRKDSADGGKEFILVDAIHGTHGPAFDHARLATALSKATGQTCKADRLPFEEIELAGGAKVLRVRVGDATWKCPLDSYDCTKDKDGPAPPADDSSPRRNRPSRPRVGSNRPGPTEKLKSPDGRFTAFVKGHDVYVTREGQSEEIRLSERRQRRSGVRPSLVVARLEALVAFRIEPGDRKEVYLVQSSPAGGGRAKLRTRPYALPGDKFTAYELNLFDVEAQEVGQAQARSGRLRSAATCAGSQDGRHFTYEKIDRGHQRFRLIAVDAHTGESPDLIDEKSETFIWTAHRESVGLATVTWLDESDEIDLRLGARRLAAPLPDRREDREAQERDHAGANVSSAGSTAIDEKKRDRSGSAPAARTRAQDPYFIHYYRVNFDGTRPGRAHRGQRQPLGPVFARSPLPDRHLQPGGHGPGPRAAAGLATATLVCKLEEADIGGLQASGWQPPEVFVAKGRDGKTDIWGIICRPKNFDPPQEIPGDRADLRRPAGLVRAQDVQPRAAGSRP